RRVRDGARPPEALLPPGQLCQARVLDERLVTEPAHDIRARVDAAGARDALELEAVADVDALRAARDALAALDAAPLQLRGLPAARIAARGIVGDDQRVVVRHRALEPRIRAQVVAELIAEPREVEEPCAGEEGDQPVAHRTRLA